MPTRSYCDIHSPLKKPLHKKCQWLRQSKATVETYHCSDIDPFAFMVLSRRSDRSSFEAEESDMALHELGLLLDRLSSCQIKASRRYISYFQEPEQSLRKLWKVIHNFDVETICKLEYVGGYVRLMHDAGVEVYHASTAVLLAALDGRKEIIERLLQQSGILHNHKACAKLLIKFIDDVNVNRKTLDTLLQRIGKGPLAYIGNKSYRLLVRTAILERRGHLLPTLVQHGIIVDLELPMHVLLSSWLPYQVHRGRISQSEADRVLINAITQLHELEAENCLIRAVRLGWTDLARSILESGADVNVYDVRMGNALWWALGNGYPMGLRRNSAAIKLLQDFGATEAFGPQFREFHTTQIPTKS